jgi:hypothetical protein
MNEDDYDKFSQDLSPKMKEAMGPSQFEDLRKTVFDASGKYVSLSEDKPENLSQQGYVVYSYFSNFEKEEVKVTISLADGGNQIEGLFFDSKNLRQGTTQ